MGRMKIPSFARTHDLIRPVGQNRAKPDWASSNSSNEIRMNRNYFQILRNFFYKSQSIELKVSFCFIYFLLIVKACRSRPFVFSRIRNSERWLPPSSLSHGSGRAGVSYLPAASFGIAPIPCLESIGKRSLTTTRRSFRRFSGEFTQFETASAYPRILKDGADVIGDHRKIHSGEGAVNINMTDVAAVDIALVGDSSHDLPRFDAVAVTDAQPIATHFDFRMIL